MASVWGELKRPSVVKVAVAYAVVMRFRKDVNG